MSKYGLRKKPTYNSLIEYIQNDQPNIKYPNRLATQITNSREMTKLDGVGMIGLEEQQLNLGVERQRQIQISELATREGTTAKHIRSIKPPRKKPSEPLFFDIASDSTAEGFLDDIEEILDEEDAKKTSKAAGVMRQVMSSLVELVPSQQDFAHRMASVASSSTSLLPSATSIARLASSTGSLIPSAASILNYAMPPTDLLLGNRPLRPYVDPADLDPLNPFTMSVPKLKPLPLPNLTLATPKPQAKYLSLIMPVPPSPKAKAVPTLKPKARQLAITAPSAAAPTVPKPTPKAKPKVTTIKQVGVQIIENKDKAFWNRQNISMLKEQAQLRGYKFNDLQIKGGYGMVLGKKVKVKGIRKAEYLEIFLKIAGL